MILIVISVVILNYCSIILFLSVLKSFSLTQGVSGPTHDRADTHNLVLSLGSDSHVTESQT